ncbi:hypothetical protein FXF68_34545 [Actinomadura decatromicini]|uniref:Recombinase zinc beta ribbon domain-containing protein n=1 Tax=Actinomadura decatromicini TaxID=2604572 RepID=A0A5D3F8X7_9ACTN|nr:hypothetical protein FXF68_34545 [Actinomadura decatromicini]
MRDRYYLGEVKVDGVWIAGRHEALVTPETFDRVQRVLDAHQGAGTRRRKHHHYLKGTVWCGRCSKRFIIQPGKGNGGLYFYFMCAGRQDKSCDQPYIPVEVMEQAVADHYARAVVLPPEFIQTVREGVIQAARDNAAMSPEERKRLERRLEAIDRKESYFLDLAADEEWPKDKLREKLLALHTEKQGIQRAFGQAERRLATGRDVLERALDLLERPHELYATSGEAVRSILNKAFFRKLYVDGDRVTGSDLKEPFDVLYRLYEVQRDHAQADAERWESGQHTPNTPKAGLPKKPGLSDLHSLIVRLDRDLGHGSSKTVMVGDTGIEPVASTVSR